MKEIKVSFATPNDILSFVSRVNNYPYDMDLKCGNIVVDAKSLLGIMSLGFNHDIILKVYSEQCDDLLNDIQKYMVE